MIIPKPLIPKRFTGKEFKRSSVLREGVTIKDHQENVEKKLEKNAQRRRRKPIHGNRKIY